MSMDMREWLPEDDLVFIVHQNHRSLTCSRLG